MHKSILLLMAVAAVSAFAALPEGALYPTTAPDGSVVYVHNPDRRTAFERDRERCGLVEGTNPQHGWNVKTDKTAAERGQGTNLYVLSPDGKTRQLTFGLHHDYCPSVSPDGQTVYFSSTRAVPDLRYNEPYHDGSGLCRVPFGGGDVEILVWSKAYAAGIIDASVSPDGKSLVWAETEKYQENWRLAIAPVDCPTNRVFVTPPDMAAHSPKWSSDGKQISFTGYRTGDPTWMPYAYDCETKRIERAGLAETVKRPDFEIIALVDSLDFSRVYDVQTQRGVTQLLDHVLLTGADTLLTRQQDGGCPRYLTREEDASKGIIPAEKLRTPSESPVNGWFSWVGNGFDHVDEALRITRARGKECGIHFTTEEAHHSNKFLNEWTLRHPEYWCRDASGKPLMFRASLSFPQVREHKLRQLDELLAMGPTTIYIDHTARNGGGGPWCEHVAPVLEEWNRRYPGVEPPKGDREPRWSRVVSKFYHDYFREIRKRLDQTGRKIRLIVTTGQEGFPVAALTDREGGEIGSANLYYYGYDWVALAREGVIDGVAVESVRIDAKHGDHSKWGPDPWGDTERLYRKIVAAAKGLPVYFPVMNYCFGEGWRPGYGTYARRCKVSEAEAVRRLLGLAKACGGAGVTLECVDFNNYSPEVRKVLRAFRESEMGQTP